MSCTVYDVTCRRYASQVHPINAAIDDAVAEGGGTIYVPGKTHFIPSPIVVPYAAGTTPYNPAPSIHIVGDGIDNTFIQRRLALDTHDLIHIERDFTTVSGITFDGEAGSDTSGRGIVIGQVLDSDPMSPGFNAERVFRRIQLDNVLVRDTAQSALEILGDNNVLTPLSINCSYTDCVFAANKVGSTACVHVQPKNTNQMFRGCTIDGFRGYGLLLEGCWGVTFFNGNIEWTQSNDRSYVRMIDARDINLENIWFEEAESSAAATNQWFVYIADACRGVAVKNCIFVKRHDIAFAVAAGGEGPSRGILISNPFIVQTVAPSVSDSPIWLLNADTEAIVEGGVVEYNATYKPVEVNDQTNYSTHLSNDRRLRLPRLSTTDVSAFISVNRRQGDVINRNISTRTGSGLEAYSNAGNMWLPLTVNRYLTDTNLNNETSRDRGTLAWVDTPALLKTYDGTSWRPVVRQVAAYDQGGLSGLTTAQTLYTPPVAGTYRVALIVTVTGTQANFTLNFRVGWTDEFSNAQLKTVGLDMGATGNHIEFDVPLNSAVSQPITISTAALTTGVFAVHARVENI